MKALPKFLLIFSILFILFFPNGKWVTKAFAQNPTPEPYWNIDLQKAKQQFTESAKILEGGQTPITYGPVSLTQKQLDLYNIIQLVGYCPPSGYDPNLLKHFDPNDKNPPVIPTPLPGECPEPKSTVLYHVALAMGSVYANPPVSLALWARDALASAGLAKPVYAQGIGFAGLSPLLPLWKATRNISYAVIILVMVAIGFMVIFRMKIDPKTVISIQAALPKIVFTLILITFSYAIVGFLIDIMYLVMAIAINLIATSIPGYNLQKVVDLQTQYMTGGVGVLWGDISWSAANSLANLFFIPWLVSSVITGLGTAVAAIPALVFGITWANFAFITAIPSLLLAAILILGILYTFIRIFLLLLNSYIQVLIAVILGPLILLNEAIPGRSAFSEWIQNVIANLVVFPTTVALLLFGLFLTGLGGANYIWTPPLLGVPLPGGNPTGTVGGVAAFLGLGIVFMAPSLVAQVKKAFGPKPTLPVSLGTIFSPLTGGFQTAMGGMSQFYYFQMLRDSLSRGSRPQTQHGS